MGKMEILNIGSVFTIPIVYCTKMKQKPILSTN